MVVLNAFYWTLIRITRKYSKGYCIRCCVWCVGVHKVTKGQNFIKNNIYSVLKILSSFRQNSCVQNLILNIIMHEFDVKWNWQVKWIYLNILTSQVNIYVKWIYLKSSELSYFLSKDMFTNYVTHNRTIIHIAF